MEIKMELSRAIDSRWQEFVAVRRDGALICARTVVDNADPYLEDWMVNTVFVASFAVRELGTFVGTPQLMKIRLAIDKLRRSGFLLESETTLLTFRLLVVCATIDPSKFEGFDIPVTVL